MAVSAKICGLRTIAAVDAALAGGAAYLGVVFFSRSPRRVDVAQAKTLSRHAAGRARIVAVLVDPDPHDAAMLALAAGADMVQLHGQEEPETVRAVRAQSGLPVIKALAVHETEDLAAAARYETVADMLLFDAKAQSGDTRPGGNARSFDWGMLKGQTFACPWFLSGGLNAQNVAQAVHVSGARLVDVSSGVERAPGEKDPALIAGFLDIVRTL